MAHTVLSLQVTIKILVDRMFGLIDTDHSGDCEASEFITTLTTISDLTTDEVTDLVRELDEDGNGKIYLE